MKKNQRGVLTIEASIVLCVTTLFILFLFNFARVYRAENMVSHATLQSADAVALESYLRETTFENDEQRVLFWANRLNGSTTISEDSFESLRTADVASIAKEKFTAAVDETSTGADNILTSLGVKDGLSGIDFTDSKVELTTNDVIVKANYTLKLQFPVFGVTELNLTKTAKAKTAGEILFGINVIPEQQIMGTTTGSGKYKFGTEVTISATANYGYDFVSWDDGNTDNPRTVTVADAKTYVAEFERHNFGVNLFISDTSVPDGRVKGNNDFGRVEASTGGTVSVGGNEYSYESSVHIKAVENPGYNFLFWRGSKVSDTGIESIYKTEQEFDVVIDGTYDLTATYEAIIYPVSVTANLEVAKNSVGVREFGTTSYQKNTNVAFGNEIELKANTLSGYTFKGWYINGSEITGSSYTKISLPVGGGQYVAHYEKDPVIKVKSNGNGTVEIGANGSTSYSCKKGTTVKIIATPNSGYYFNGWSDGGEETHWVTVNSDVTYTASFDNYISVNVISGGGGTVSGGGSNIKKGTITISASPNTGYEFVKWQYSTNGGANYYDANSTSTTFKPNVTQSITYKAIFKKKVYTVSFNVNGGRYAIPSITVEHGKTISNFQKPVGNGKQFVAWQLNGSNCSSVTVTSNITLVAKWKNCSGHVWGHCGVKHYIFSDHSKCQWFEYIAGQHTPNGSGHNRWWNSHRVCKNCGLVSSRYCGSCTSWKKADNFVDIHGVGTQDISGSR